LLLEGRSRIITVINEGELPLAVVVLADIVITMPLPTPASSNALSLSLFPISGWALRTVVSQARTLLMHVGQAMQLLIECGKALISGGFRFNHFLEQAAFSGVDTLPVALVLTAFAGMVISLQVAQEMTKQGASTFVGALVSLALVRELAPIMTGFSLIAMGGAAYAAEITTMKANNQLDALTVLHLSPVRYLMLPRLLAMGVTLPLLTLLTGYCGLVGAQWVAHATADLSGTIFWDSVWQQTHLYDIMGALLKAAVFGVSTALISCTVGFTAPGTASQVGQATTRAVVISFVAMALLDFGLSYLLYGGRQ
jgi:phospholipid/cholesterol/gamma-HCH transport system permease protein